MTIQRFSVAMGQRGDSMSGVTILTDDDIDSEILAIIRNAKKEVLLVSPYLSFWQHLRDEIELAVNRGVDVSVLTREDADNNEAALDWLYDIVSHGGLLEYLHAKIYVNEKVA